MGKEATPTAPSRCSPTLVRKNPGISKYYVHLGMALLQKGDKKNARLNLQNALANQPSKAEESEIRELLKRAA